MRLRSLTIVTLFSFLMAGGWPAQAAKAARATFAGGCFWCVEEIFDGLEGVVSATSGFTASRVEAVEIVYEPDKISYEKLLDLFWRNIDPTDSRGQFCDRGSQYTTGIFYHDEIQRSSAEQSKAGIESILNREVVTPIVPASPFTPAAVSHQDYYKKNKLHYKQYKLRCGRERRLRELWGRDQ